MVLNLYLIASLNQDCIVLLGRSTADKSGDVNDELNSSDTCASHGSNPGRDEESSELLDLSQDDSQVLRNIEFATPVNELVLYHNHLSLFWIFCQMICLYCNGTC